jgi:hypothetical protein
MSLLRFEREYPSIPWREPINVSLDSGDFLGCRVCIGEGGLRGDGTPPDRLFTTREAFDEHFARHLS